MFEGSPPVEISALHLANRCLIFYSLDGNIQAEKGYLNLCVLGDGFWILLFELRSQRLARFALWGSAVHIAYVSVFAVFGL